LIQLEGFSAITARNGREALELLKTIPTPGMILLDLMMPEMSGSEFIAAVQERAELRNIPIVVMTAWRKRIAELPARATEVLLKPINSARLLELVRRYCGGPSAGGTGPHDAPSGNPRTRKRYIRPREIDRRLTGHFWRPGVARSRTIS
jgi:CheY-like chemotaxis protein